MPAILKTVFSFALAIRRQTRLVLLFGLGFCILPALGAEGGKAVDPHNVKIYFDHGIALPWGKPGFRISITGWQPNGDLFLYAISPEGAQLALIPREKPVQADEDGNFTVDIDYARKGIEPGHWMFLAGGKSGIHEFEADMPRIIPPDAGHPKWRLMFGQQNTKSK